MKEWILENTTVKEEEYDSLIKSNTVNMVEEKDKQENREDYEIDYSHPFTTIKVFTLKKPTKLRCVLFGVKKEKDYYLYRGVKFRVLAEAIPSLEEFLYAEGRNGKAFKTSIGICSLLSSANDKVITALCNEPSLKGNKKFIHSFVVYTTNEGKELVIDTSLNILMEKDNSNAVEENIEYTNIIAPIQKGDMIGKITYTYEGIQYETELIADSNVEESKTLTSLFKLLLVALIIFIIYNLKKSNKKYGNHGKKYKKKKNKKFSI